MTDRETMRIHDDAIAWHIRLADGEDSDWEDFADWLEADPRHNVAYEAVADADKSLDKIVDLAPAVMTSTVTRPADEDARPLRSASRSRLRIAAVAATVSLVAGGAWLTFGETQHLYTISTAPGETRQIALSDGTRIAMNGSTELELDRADPRHAELKSGEVRLTVTHDEAHPFALTVDDQRIVDVGTVFNVQKSARALRVEVAEGAVRFEDGDVRLRLNAGDTLVSSGDRIVEGTLPVSAIGSWARGRLVYQTRPLSDVVADLSRSRGIAIELGPNLSGKPFTGVIQLDGSDEAVRSRFEQLLRLKVAKTPDGWSISE
jgi:transmembrane sensor